MITETESSLLQHIETLQAQLILTEHRLEACNKERLELKEKLEFHGNHSERFYF